MYFIGIFFYLLIIILAMNFYGIAGVMINTISLLIILGINFAVIIGTRSIRDFTYAIKVLSSKEINNNKNNLTNSISLFHLLWKSTLGAGIIGFIIGIVSLFRTIDNPSTVGPALAVSITSVLYSIIIAIGIFLPALYILKRVEREN